MKHVSTRLFALLVFSLAFGIAVAVLKGGDAGIRDSIGNVSAPWLLLPYFAGTVTRDWRRGGALGLTACLAALIGFYVAEAFVLDLGEHPILTNLVLTLGAGRQYVAAGLICGPLLGALGALRHRTAPVGTAAVVGLALVGEPPAVFAWLASIGVSSADTGMVVHYPALWMGEMLLGLGLGAALLAHGVHRQRAQSAVRDKGM